MFEGLGPVVYYKDNGKPHDAGQEWRLDLPHVQYGGVFELASFSTDRIRIIADMSCMSDTCLASMSSFHVLELDHWYTMNYVNIKYSEAIRNKQYQTISKKEYVKLKLKHDNTKSCKSNPILFSYDYDNPRYDEEELTMIATSCVLNYKANHSV